MPLRFPLRPLSWLMLLAAVSCNAPGSQQTNAAGNAASTTTTSTSSDSSGVRLLVAGDSLRFIEHSENLAPGFPASIKPVEVKNPYEGDKQAIGTSLTPRCRHGDPTVRSC